MKIPNGKNNFKKMERKPVILIADDIPENLQVLGNLLDQNKYNIAVAVDGKQALDIAKEIQPDLILLDVMMPRLDGFEVCKKLKKLKKTEEIPVIFITARSDSNDIVRGFKLGGIDYITKPFQTAEIVARVETHIQLKLARDKEKHLIRELQIALEKIETLSGLLPICSHCKKIRSDDGYWQQVEVYVEKHSKAQFSHGICPTCLKKYYSEYMDDEEK